MLFTPKIVRRFASGMGKSEIVKYSPDLFKHEHVLNCLECHIYYPDLNQGCKIMCKAFVSLSKEFISMR